jgi:cytochrome c-type biogenesis protein CcmE
MTATAAAPVSRTTAWKIVASVAAVAIAVGFLLYQSTREGAEYYKHVDEVMARPADLLGRRLQVHGHVVEGSIEQARGTLEYRFRLESRDPRPPAVIEAHYRGLVPDTFKSGAEVVAKGTLTPDHRLEVVPDGIMAKCPSKYEAKGPPRR